MLKRSISSLVAGFEDATLPQEEWTHIAHLAVALVYVRAHGREAATSKMRDGIKRFNAAKGGEPSAYHETITLAWIAVVARFVSSFHANGATPSLEELARLLAHECADKRYLLRFYERDTLMSDVARTSWVPPDRAPIDSPSEAIAPTNAPRV